jgi:hypothetical protein
VGIALEAVGGSAQELRDRREIPITLLGMDMPEIDGQVGQ